MGDLFFKDWHGLSITLVHGRYVERAAFPRAVKSAINRQANRLSCLVPKEDAPRIYAEMRGSISQVIERLSSLRTPPSVDVKEALHRIENMTITVEML
jgi:hypothetical protein